MFLCACRSSGIWALELTLTFWCFVARIATEWLRCKERKVKELDPAITVFFFFIISLGFPFIIRFPFPQHFLQRLDLVFVLREASLLQNHLGCSPRIFICNKKKTVSEILLRKVTRRTAPAFAVSVTAMVNFLFGIGNSVWAGTRWFWSTARCSRRESGRAFSPSIAWPSSMRLSPFVILGCALTLETRGIPKHY